MTSCSYRFSAQDYKSSFRNLTHSFFSGREKWRRRSQKWRHRLDQSIRENQRLINENRKLKHQLAVATKSLPPQPPSQLTDEQRLKGHQFGAKMIAMCCELCKCVGFRATERILPVIRQWLGLSLRVPTRNTMRSWCSRYGIAVMQQARQKADDWIWLIDHHVQIGKEVALVILGIRQSELPIDRPLQRGDMKPLAVVSSTSRRKEDVEQALVELTDFVYRNFPVGPPFDGQKRSLATENQLCWSTWFPKTADRRFLSASQRL